MSPNVRSCRRRLGLAERNMANCRTAILVCSRPPSGTLEDSPTHTPRGGSGSCGCSAAVGGGFGEEEPGPVEAAGASAGSPGRCLPPKTPFKRFFIPAAAHEPPVHTSRVC